MERRGAAGLHFAIGIRAKAGNFAIAIGPVAKLLSDAEPMSEGLGGVGLILEGLIEDLARLIEVAEQTKGFAEAQSGGIVIGFVCDGGLECSH